MPERVEQLAVRSHQRFSCKRAADVAITPHDASLVRLSRVVLGTSGSVRVELVDFSDGGLGIRSSVYLPPGLRLGVVVGEEDGTIPTRTSVPGRVQRTQMVDRGPTYYLGISFTESDASTRTLVERLKQGAESAGPRRPGDAC